MNTVLPQATGLTVEGVIYQYTTVKNTSDPMVVTLQNKNAVGEGYIFRKQDDWTGLKENTITKLVPTQSILGTRWGDGEFKIEGTGEIKNQTVIYKYKYDTCADPTSDPRCPNYIPKVPKLAETLDPLEDELLKKAIENKVFKEEEKKIEIHLAEKKEKEAAIKKAISNSLVSQLDAQRALQFEMMNNIPGYNLYTVSMPGGVYKDVLKFPEKYLPDNRRGRNLGLAQEQMHNSMVDLQYSK